MMQTSPPSRRFAPERRTCQAPAGTRRIQGCHNPVLLGASVRLDHRAHRSRRTLRLGRPHAVTRPARPVSKRILNSGGFRTGGDRKRGGGSSGALTHPRCGLIAPAGDGGAPPRSPPQAPAPPPPPPPPNHPPPPPL